MGTTTGTYATSKNGSFSIISTVTAHKTSVHDTFVETGSVDAYANGVSVGIDKVVALKAAHHGRAVLEGALIVASAGILPRNAIDVFL